MIRARTTWAAATAVLTLLGAAPAAHAGPQPPGAASVRAVPDGTADLPSGWRITGTGAARSLEWRSPRVVRPGDARVEFHAEGRLLGVPEPDGDGRTFRLPLDAAAPPAPDGLTDLQVRAAGRRLDEKPGDTARQRRPSDAPPAKLPPQLPAGAVDPGRPGRFATSTGEYTLDPVRLPGLSAPVEMRGVVVAPKGASGKRPLALFLHGRHATCYVPGQGEEAVTIDWPCADDARPIPSHRGYLQDQKLLASQGYVTVSISANGINGQDGALEDGGAQARSTLVRAHLARWADWAAGTSTAPAAVRRGPKADPSRVLLVGHSRGGEGVARAAMDSLYPPPASQDGHQGRTRWNIRGTVLVGPTAFGQNPVPDVPSLTILPGCDGDVADLQGQLYVDGTRGVSRGRALHSAVHVTGANHNYFNSEWTPGLAQAPASDDFWEDPEDPDPVCSVGSPTRLTAGQQHRAGATYIAAAARLFVAGDDRVRELIDGTGRRAPSADPARVLTHAVGAGRGAGLLPDGGVKVTGGRLCSAIDPDPDTACLGEDARGSSPHFAYWGPEREAGRSAIALDWSAPGTAIRVRPGAPVSLKGARSLALRVIVPPGSTGTRLDVSVTDAAGRRATLGAVHADGLPGSDRTASYWAQELRVPLTAAARAGVDLRRVASLELTPRSRAGKAWLMDAYAWQAGTPEVRPAPLTRVDVGRATVKEGDSGVRTYHVPVRVFGKKSGTVRTYVTDPATGDAETRLVTVGPGSPGIDVSVKVTGNERYAWDISHDVLVKAVHGSVVGSYLGGVTVENDDPMPRISVTPVADEVTEGQPLRWRVSLSEPADVELGTTLVVVPDDARPELSTMDVDRDWLLETAGEVPDGEVPLSRLDYFWLGATVPPGMSDAEVTVPTIGDEVAEPTEYLGLRSLDDEGEPQGPVLTGTVLDAP
ncbi:alpha/beta hydrolase family protein [Streptomyces sp. BBFR51]|uniref:alpha/beta hydrolase family protein n=1 Tax=Streptomyces sp. BBFR51 TaxID=3372856 RepID=UPI0037DC03FC